MRLVPVFFIPISLTRIWCATSGSCILAYMAISFLFSVVYLESNRFILFGVINLSLTSIYFCMSQLRNAEQNLYYFLMHCIWPQLILVSGFLVASGHYKRALETMNDLNKELQRLSRAKSDFLSIIGHEVGTV